MYYRSMVSSEHILLSNTEISCTNVQHFPLWFAGFAWAEMESPLGDSWTLSVNPLQSDVLTTFRYFTQFTQFELSNTFYPKVLCHNFKMSSNDKLMRINLCSLEIFYQTEHCVLQCSSMTTISDHAHSRDFKRASRCVCGYYTTHCDLPTTGVSLYCGEFGDNFLFGKKVKPK